MKKVFLTLLAASFITVGFQKANAQTPYNTALGLGIDLGDGQTLVGQQIKHTFGGANAGNAQVLFGDNHVLIGVDYSYNRQFPGTNGLGWYVGVGPQLSFVDRGNDDDTYCAIRPGTGWEHKSTATPV